MSKKRKKYRDIPAKNSQPASTTPSTRAVPRPSIRRSRSSQWILWMVAAIILIGGLIVLNSGNKPAAAAVSPERLNQDPTLGAATAPVTLIEYGDLGCTSCRAWHLAGIRDQILKQFDGQVKYVWKDFPIITAQSPKAAEAGQCALDQGKFFEFQDLVYHNFLQLSVSDLEGFAATLGLNTSQFNQCFESGQYAAKVQHSWNEARQLPVQATPAWVVNGQYLYNASPEVLTAAIQKALAQQ